MDPRLMGAIIRKGRATSARLPSLSEAEAVRILGRGEAALEGLRSSGIGLRDGRGVARFDGDEVATLALHTRPESPMRFLMKRWVTEVERSTLREDRGRARSLRLTVQCPTPHIRHECKFSVAGMSVEPVQAEVPGSLWLEVQPRISTAKLNVPERIIAACEEMAEWIYIRVRDFWLSREAGVAGAVAADCRQAAHRLAGACASNGVTHRPAWGYVLTPPLATAHHWVEVRTRSGWVSLDPLMSGNLARWGLLPSDGVARPNILSPILGSLTSREPDHLVRHDGRPVCYEIEARP